MLEAESQAAESEAARRPEEHGSAPLQRCALSEAIWERRWDRRVLLFIFALGLLVVFAHRYTASPDALSYLEVGESWWRGEFRAAIVGYWSPLYPILLAAAAKLAPSRAVETIPMHLFQFGLLFAAWFAFRWFAREVERAFSKWSEAGRRSFRVAASAVFIWASFCYTDVAGLVPDMLLEIWLLLAAGHLLKLQRTGEGRNAAALGAFLGLGYLTKPVLFPLGLLFLGFAVPFPEPTRRRFGLVAMAGGVFLALSATYIVPLSLQKGRFTFSDSGTLAYAWEVNGTSPYFHWQGQPPGTGTPAHPTRQILDNPPSFEFDRGRPGTYPLWYDASYWNEGLKARFILTKQLRRLADSAQFYTRLLFADAVSAVLLFSLFLVLAVAGWKRLGALTRPFISLILVSVAACGMYGLVFVIPRYLGGFILLVCVPLIAVGIQAGGFSVGAQERWTRAFAGFALFYVVGFSVYSGAFGLFGAKSTSYKVHAKVAQALQTGGLGADDKVAVIGRGCDAYFARIGRFKIVGEAPVLGGHPVWPATAANFRKMETAFFAETQARALVTDVLPLEPLSGWQEVPGTGYRVRFRP